MRLKLYLYITDKWNILDLTTFATYAVGLILRFIPLNICSTCFYASRIIFALDHMLFFFRILHIFSAHQELGPKLVMIGRMMIDLIYFVIILLVFIASYGITSQAILYPNSPLSIGLARDVLSQAWWDVYGQMNIAEVSGQSCASSTTNPTCNKNYTAFECAANGYDVSECCNKDDLCPAIDWFVPILLAIYALITNVMMLNLLIAMFSHTFSTVQDNTTVVWKMQRFQLVKEYDIRPFLPPPLIIFSHIVLLVRHIIHSTCSNCCPEKTGSSGFRMTFSTNDPLIKRLLDWENINALEYLRKTELSASSTLESRVKVTLDRVEDIAQKVDEMAELSFLMQSTATTAVQPKLPPVLDDRLGYIEEQMKRTSRALDWIIATLMETRSPPSDPPCLPDVDQQREIARKRRDDEVERTRDSVRVLLKSQLEIHVKSRTSIYPTTNTRNVITRFVVPDDKVPFNVEFSEYKPFEFTDPNVPINIKADLSYVPGLSTFIPAFNENDVINGIDRRSYIGRYKVIGGAPQNPQGRTGLKGRGVLGFWGPNHACNALVTRWRKNDEGDVFNGGKRVLEFVSTERSDNHQWAIPGKFIPNSHYKVYECLHKVFSNEMYSQLEKEFFKKGKRIYHGYSDDPRNTDNAWVETVAYNYHDEEGSILGDIDIRAGDFTEVVHWQKVSSKQEMFATHLEILSALAKLHNSAF